MTRLAPNIITAILDGRQPRHLNLHALRGQEGGVPLDWEEQRGVFGFEAVGTAQDCRAPTLSAPVPGI